VIFGFTGCLALFFPIFAGEDWPRRPPERPRTVLVLSGGGARGMAHIGVLEVLEQLDVPFDAIVGTSMGAIVGGMYAAGLSPEQMREELQRIDWHSAFNDNPPRKYVPYRRKEEDVIPLFEIEAGYNKKRGFSVPAGIVAGQKLNFILRSMLLHTAVVDSFDDLAIPFRAIATDLDSGEAVVIDRGDLAGAIRASMAFPVMFTPVTYQGKLLIDGGVVRNLPLDVALDLGAERIIAVDVGAEFGKMKNESPSAMQVLRRTSSIQTKTVREEVLELLRDQDILIRPEFDGQIGFADFDAVGLAEKLGREAALEQRDRLERLSVDAAAFDGFIQRQRAGVEVGPLQVTEIAVEGLQRVPESRILKRIRTRPGDALDLGQLQEDLERVYLIGEFETVEFRLQSLDDGTRLVIDAQEKSWGPWYFRAGLALSANFSGSGEFLLNVLARRSELNRLGAEWRTLASMGSEETLISGFYQPLSQAGTWFVGPYVFLNQDDDEIVIAFEQQYLAESRYATANLDLGRALGQWGQIRFGPYYGKADVSVSLPLEEEQRETVGGFQFRFGIDRLDKAYFPKHGTWLFLSGRFSRDQLGADQEYDRAELSFNQVYSTGENTFVLRAKVGGDLGSSLPFYDDLELGGFLNLSGFRFNELRGQRLGYGALIFYRRLNQTQGLFGMHYYLGASLEAGNTWLDAEAVTFESLRAAGSIYLGAESLFGPIYVGVAAAEGPGATAFFQLGRVF
jgi:NTE family protein